MENCFFSWGLSIGQLCNAKQFWLLQLFKRLLLQVGTSFLGPRIGHFHPGKEGIRVDIKGHSVLLAALGAFILIFGFFAFNGGSQVLLSLLHPYVRFGATLLRREPNDIRSCGLSKPRHVCLL